VERLARCDRRHAATVEQWDSHPWELNTPTGTIDLRTGEIHSHRQEHYLTKLTAVGPGGDCPLWLRFLERITGRDADLAGFLQRMVGYALTGSTREHALFFLYGTGANGKSVFLSTVSSILGEYAKTAPASSFTANVNEQHPTDMASLRGARFVTAIEVEDGARWAEAKVKSLTGGDRIAARFMRQDFFEFAPEFKLCVCGNHKPSLRAVDEAIRRRLHLVPFTVTIPTVERDTNLVEKLVPEWPGILNWAIQGCLDWQSLGLNPPSAVRDATAEYLTDEDAFGHWIEERCVLGARCMGKSSSLYADYAKWCEDSQEKSLSQRRFSQELKRRGYQVEHSMVGSVFNGIGLRESI
jgi:putative DNA primase/helicase